MLPYHLHEDTLETRLLYRVLRRAALRENAKQIRQRHPVPDRHLEARRNVICYARPRDVRHQRLCADNVFTRSAWEVYEVASVTLYKLVCRSDGYDTALEWDICSKGLDATYPACVLR